MTGRKVDALAGRDRSGNYLPPVREGAFQTAVIQAARLYGWKVVHFRKTRTTGGRGSNRPKWHTAYEGDGGAPDLLLAKGGRVLWVELKSQTGSRSPDQRAWAAAIGPEVYRLWRPSDMDTVIVAELSGRGL